MATDRNGDTHRPRGNPGGGQPAARTDAAPAPDRVGEPAPIAVLPIEYETHNWTPRAPQMFSRAEVTRQTGDFESAITRPITPQQISISGADAADIDEAARALVTFDNEALHRLGSDSPVLGPMSAILLRTESASSSQIEQLTTSAKQIALAEIDEGARVNAGMVVGNVRAMEAALALSDEISVDSILAMHRELLLPSAEFADQAGKFRDEAVWIGGDNAGPRGASYIAPQYGLVPAAVEDVVAFSRRTDLPALVQVAIAHAQFETIHPFVDGNGRTGRALAQAMIRNLGLARHTTVPISAGLLTDTSTYFDALTAYRAGDAGPIVRRFADAARFAASSGRDLVDQLADQIDESRKKLSGLRPQSAAWRVLPYLVGQPIMNLRYLRERLGLNDMTALRALDALAQRGVITERTSASRNRVWEHRGILRVLDEYAATVRRAAH